MSHSKVAFLFPGQGSQYIGMGREFYETHTIAKATFEEADEALDMPLTRLIFEGTPEDLQLTEYTQPAILTASVAAYRVLMETLEPHGIAPAFAAGHSLGEYTAHVAAGSLTFADALRTVRARGQYMQAAVPPGTGAMAAILGLEEPEVNDLCAKAADELSVDTAGDLTPTEAAELRAANIRAIVAPANLNSPHQIVISGATEAVHRAMDLCKAAGARKTILLKVSAPFHCLLMQPAADELATTLEAVPFADPAFPVVSNVDARLVTRGPDIRDSLIRQVTAPVRWAESIQQLIFQGATRFVEVGPGKVLTGLLRQIDRDQTGFHVEDGASLDKAVTALTQ